MPWLLRHGPRSLNRGGLLFWRRVSTCDLHIIGVCQCIRIFIVVYIGKRWCKKCSTNDGSKKWFKMMIPQGGSAPAAMVGHHFGPELSRRCAKINKFRALGTSRIHRCHSRAVVGGRTLLSDRRLARAAQRLHDRTSCVCVKTRSTGLTIENKKAKMATMTKLMVRGRWVFCLYNARRLLMLR